MAATSIKTKIRLSFNNLFNEHSITGDSITGTALTQSINANGTTYTDPFFNTLGPTPIAGGDNISVLPGRSVMLSVTFGLSSAEIDLLTMMAVPLNRLRRGSSLRKRSIE